LNRHLPACKADAFPVKLQTPMAGMAGLEPA
jgi:hypothetical protein